MDAADTMNASGVPETPTDTEVLSPRDRLVAVAEKAFAQRGFSGTSVAEIAQEADISKSTVFHHFPTKRALYWAVIETAAQAFSLTLDAVLDEGQSVSEALSQFQTRHLAHIMDNEQVTRLVLRELQKGESPETVELIRDVLAANFQRLVDWLTQAQKADLINSHVDTSTVALTLISANVFYQQHHALLKHLPHLTLPQNPDQYATSVVALLIEGLGKDDDDE